ncbi:class I SAM-dependent methyltransferase [Microlunatus sp. Gsoil 973]|jgi:16S rRNA G1207 methylase RsmC|uniref:class I SAM-dependent methyltransferase n=1 Tax=Microlunatus sp. Gsoil 973 TaxID=2672569 RepID=UPI0012B44FFF|nr:methyltransferase [Microlunatus sp. Gsoil 973]QGN35101.1 methyltransferase [Microlunatus sp. Gsoil 973]
MTDHYFTNSPNAGRNRQTTTATIWGTEYRFITASGVFARSGLDIATQVLLRSLEPPVGVGRLCDVGCGYGPIAIALADHCPGAVVDAVDVNDTALGLCAENATLAGVADRVLPMRPEQADPNVRYDEIWSNPPIRIGKQALHDLLLLWLPRLRPGGAMRMVVGKNLGADTLQAWLADQGYPCDRVASAKGFRVLVARTPG